MSWSSGQDGGTGRNPSLPHTTKRRITTNLKSINNQKCQKIKLHGTPTTKELKKQSTRPTRPVRTLGEAADYEGGASWEKLREVVDHRGRAGWTGNWDSELSGLQWGLSQWEKLPVSHESWLESTDRADKASCIVPSLAPPPQAVPKRSKEGCPALVNT